MRQAVRSLQAAVLRRCRAVCAILDAFHFLEPEGEGMEEGGAPAAAETEVTATAAAAGEEEAAAAAEGDGPEEADVAAEGEEGAEEEEEEGAGAGAGTAGSVPREEVYRLLVK